MFNACRSIILGALLISALAAVATAQVMSPANERATSRGLVLGMHVGATQFTQFDPRATRHGIGLDVTAGWGLGDRVRVLTTVGGAGLGPRGSAGDVMHLDLLAEVALLRGSVGGWAPQAVLGVSGRTAEYAPPGGSTSRPASYASLGPTLGLGAARRLSGGLLLDAGVRYSWGDFARLECPETGDAIRTCSRSIRTRVGVQWTGRRR